MNKLIFLLITTFASMTFAQGSFGVRGGGNTCVEQFISLAKIIHSSVKTISYDADLFREKIYKADIVEVQSEMINYEGNRYIAMNEPAANRIYLSQKWCRESSMARDEDRTSLIVFHEILGLSEPGRDSNYELSSQLYDDTGFSEKDFYYLAITNGRDRHVFKTDVYTWARFDSAYTRRVSLNRAGFDNKKSSIVDCGNNQNTNVPAILIILGQNGPYNFKNKSMCENVLEFLAFRSYADFKITFLVGTTSKIIYDVILE